MAEEPESPLEVRIKKIKEINEAQEAFSAYGWGNLKDDETRQEVAKKFVKWYFSIFLFIIVIVPIYNYFMYRLNGNAELQIPLKDIILTYSAVVGPTLGLVIAYYFKTKNI